MEISIDPDRIHARLVDLLRLPSVCGEEEAAVSRLAEWLRDAGAEVDHWSEAASSLREDPAYPGDVVERSWAPSVAGIVRGSRPGPTILLTGHIDVVPPGPYEHWSLDPYGGFTRGDRVYGRGASDMKAGLVSALEVVEQFADGDRDFAGRLLFIAVSGEEDSGLGTLSAIRRGYGAHAAIIPEPTHFDGPQPSIAVAHAGAMSMRIVVNGQGAHASNRMAGQSALDHYLAIHQALKEDEEALNQGETNPLMKSLGLPYPTNVGTIHGGMWSSTVMERLEVEVRIGVALSETIDEAEARFRRAIERATARDPWLAENPPQVSRICGSFGSAETTTDHPLVAALDRAGAAAFGARPPVTAAPYCCDMAGWVRLAGIPTVLYGPGELDLAHAPDESVSLEHTVKMAGALAHATEELLRLDVEPLPEIGLKE